MTDPANAASREARAIVEAIMTAEAEHTVRDMAGHVGEEVHGVLKRHAMLMKTTGGAIAVGVLAAIEVLHDTLEFACRSMDDDDERTQMATAIGTLFATQADARLGLALADEAASQPREGVDTAQLAFDQQSDDPKPGDWNDACVHIAEQIRRHTTESDGSIYARHSAALHDTAPTDQAQGGGEVKRLRAELARRDANETRNCVNWGPCSRHDGRMSALAQSKPTDGGMAL